MICQNSDSRNISKKFERDCENNNCFYFSQNALLGVVAGTVLVDQL